MNNWGAGQLPVVLTGDDLTIEDVVDVARQRRTVAPVSTGPSEVLERIGRSAQWVAGTTARLGEGTTTRAYYGINTGFGHKAGRAAFRDPEDARRLSRNLILSHSVGVGDYLPEDVVRAAMLIRTNTLTKGVSGVRPELIDTLIAMLNKGVYPAIPEKGSVGASGDLAPLAHLALVLSRAPDGEDRDDESGEAFVHSGGGWQLVSGKEAMAQACIERLALGAKEGLALNNGTAFSTAMAALAIHDAENLVDNAEIALALTLEAWQGFRDPFLPHLHVLRPHPGQTMTAQRVTQLVDGSQLLDGDEATAPRNCPPQDPYSIRCAPQVIGAVRDTLRHCRLVVETELNAATDNPLILTDLARDYKAVSGGNFHGEPIAFAMDFLGIAVTELGSIAERRIFQLIEPPKHTADDTRYALPSCLITDEEGKEGLRSGLLMLQYTAAALVSDCKTLAHPDSVDSIPTGAYKEDHVSMSTNAARHAGEIISNVEHVIACEMLCAAQALDFVRVHRPVPMGARAEQAYMCLRQAVQHVPTDRLLYPDIRRVVSLIRNGSIVNAAWQDVGGQEGLRIQDRQHDIAALEAYKRRCTRALRGRDRNGG